MPRREHGAAVLVGEDRCLKCPDAPRDRHNFVFVHTDARAEQGDRHCRPGHCHGFHGLRGDLPEALPRNEGAGVPLTGATLCELHHKVAEQERKVLLGAFAREFFLHMGQRHDVHVDLRGETAELLGERKDLFPRTLGGVRVGLKMDGFQFQPALRHHVPGNRGIDPPGEQEHPAPGAPERQPAGAFFLPGVEVGGVLAHLDPHHGVRVMEIHLQSMCGGEDGTAHAGGDLGGVQGEGFVGALGVDAERAGAGEFLRQVVARDAADVVDVLLRDGGTRDADDAEHVAGALVHTVEIRLVVQRFDINGGLRVMNFKSAVVPGATAQFFRQSALEGGLVRAFQHEFSVLAKNDFFHSDLIAVGFISV